MKATRHLISVFAISCLIAAPVKAQSNPSSEMSQFYQSCLESGGMPGILRADSTGGDANVTLHSGRQVDFDLVIAPHTREGIRIVVRLTQSSPGAISQSITLIPGRSYAGTASGIVIESANLGESFRYEYCLRTREY